MKKEKLYFRSIDETFCSALEGFIVDAKNDGLKEITLIEAIPDNDNTDSIWCTHEGEVTERDMCKKAECEFYSSKSGRGKCMHRGNLFNYGEEVKFDLTVVDGF